MALPSVLPVNKYEDKAADNFATWIILATLDISDFYANKLDYQIKPHFGIWTQNCVKKMPFCQISQCSSHSYEI